jgi:DNA-binding LacI/PurR family transcriptional regulator
MKRMMKPKSHGKTRALTDYILERIYTGEYKAGAAIPPIRSLMRQFGVSQYSVQRTIEKMVADGLLETVHGCGVFVRSQDVSSQKQKNKMVIGVAFPKVHLDTSIYGNVFMGIQLTALQQGIFLQTGYSYEPGKNKQLVSEELQGLDGLIILSEYDNSFQDLSLPFPVIGVCMHNSFNDMISLLDMDPFSASRQAVAFFKARKHNKLNIVSMDTPAYKARGDILADEWRRSGGVAVFLEPDDLMSVHNEHAFVFTSGGTLQRFLMACRQRLDIELEKHADVLGFDGKCLIDPDLIGTPVIAVDWTQVGHIALEDTVNRIKNPGQLPRRIYVPGKLKLPF